MFQTKLYVVAIYIPDYDVRIVDCDFIINFCLVHLVKAHNHLISSNAT